jgi:hypothetical protein
LTLAIYALDTTPHARTHARAQVNVTVDREAKVAFENFIYHGGTIEDTLGE